jgi:hypothetical protein
MPPCPALGDDDIFNGYMPVGRRQRDVATHAKHLFALWRQRAIHYHNIVFCPAIWAEELYRLRFGHEPEYAN